MKVIIIEDEQLAANHLEKMIVKYDCRIHVIAKLESVSDAVEWFQNNEEPDLVFLDIHLEDDLSFSIFDKIKISAPVIFTTAYDEYAVKAFKLKSIDYLLKPIMQEDVNRSIDKYKNWQKPNFDTSEISSLIEMMTKKETSFRERLSVNTGQKIKTISITDIAYFYSEEGMTFIVLNDKSEYPVDYSLDNLSEQLNPKEFFRINRQYLIKLKSIKNVFVYPKSRLKIELFPPTEKDVFVSLDKVTKFKDWLDG